MKGELLYETDIEISVRSINFTCSRNITAYSEQNWHENAA